MLLLTPLPPTQLAPGLLDYRFGQESCFWPACFHFNWNAGSSV